MHIKHAIVAIHIPERNRQILQMRKEGVRRSDVARKFNLVDGMTDMELGNRCNEEWQKTLARVKRQWEFPGVTRETYLRITENL